MWWGSIAVCLLVVAMLFAVFVWCLWCGLFWSLDEHFGFIIFDLLLECCLPANRLLFTVLGYVWSLLFAFCRYFVCC